MPIWFVCTFFHWLFFSITIDHWVFYHERNIVFPCNGFGGGDKPLAVVIKGGHLRQEPVDVCYDGASTHHIEGVRVAGSIHGSGCRYASALAAQLAKGESVVDAARAAKQYVTNLIRERMALVSA